jgi:hypothetical protein
MLDRPVRLALLAAAATALSFSLASPALSWGRDVSIDSRGDGGGCEAFRVRFGGEEAIRETQTVTVPGGTPLLPYMARTVPESFRRPRGAGAPGPPG